MKKKIRNKHVRQRRLSIHPAVVSGYLAAFSLQDGYFRYEPFDTLHEIARRLHYYRFAFRLHGSCVEIVKVRQNGRSLAGDELQFLKGRVENLIGTTPLHESIEP